MSSTCGACHGSGWVSRDPDIGTEQECFSCEGSGVDEDADEDPPAAMPEPLKAQQSEYYRLYTEIEASFEQQPFVKYEPKSRLIHAEVVRGMGLNEVKEMK